VLVESNELAVLYILH